jgi:nucleotide-binding universal stress UspA family protein
MYDTLLIPTDGSEAARRAVEHGAELAAFHDADVHLLYVVDATSFSGMGTEAVGSDPITAATGEGEDILADAAGRLTAHDIEATTVVEQGVPDETILRYIRDHDIDVVVMGTHGRSGIQRFLEGSVTEQVVRSSAAPVLTLSDTSV